MLPIATNVSCETACRVKDSRCCLSCFTDEILDAGFELEKDLPPLVADSYVLVLQEAGTVMPEAKLVRRLRVVAATAIVVSNMIGTGIFTTTGFLAGNLGSPSLVIWIWVVGGALARAGALCYAELALNFPRSGGEYVYLKEACGNTVDPIDVTRIQA